MDETDQVKFAFYATPEGVFWHALKMNFFSALIIVALCALPFITLHAFVYLPELLNIIIGHGVIIIICLGFFVGLPIFISIYFCKWFIPKISYGVYRLDLQFDCGMKQNIKKGISENLKLIIAAVILLLIIGGVSAAVYYFYRESLHYHRQMELFIRIQTPISLFAFIVVINVIIAAITKLVVDNTSMGDNKFSFNKSSYNYFKILMFESFMAFIFIPLTLGIYSLWMVLRYLRITASCIEHSGKQVEFDQKLGVWELFIMGLVSGLLSSISLGLLAPWRFVVDTNKIFGYAKLK